MSMQSDVQAATLVESGFAYKQRTRVRGISIKGTASAATVGIFDTSTVPVAATYARSGYTVTVTKTGHGLSTGDQLGLAFQTGTGGTATSGNYVITRVDADTFTITDINTGSITAGAACAYAQRWIMNFRIAAGDVYENYFLVPGQGFLAINGVYLLVTNVAAASIFHG